MILRGQGSFWQQEDGTFLIWLWNMDFEGGGACEEHSCNCRCHCHFLRTTNFRNISGEERRTVKELVLFLPCVRWLEARRTFPNDDFVPPLCFCSTAESERLPLLLQSVQCKYCHIKSEWTCCLCRSQEVGKRAISQSLSSEALRMPKLFFFFPFVFCTN